MEQATDNKDRIINQSISRSSVMPVARCLLLTLPLEAITVSDVRLHDASQMLRDREVAAIGLSALLLS
jgi:hypothetical protein